MEVVFQDVIAEATERGTSVFLSSHILAQVEALADRISIIRDGRIVETGTLSELRHMTRTTMEMETASPARPLAELDGVHGFRTDGARAVFEVDGERVDEVLRAAAALGIRSLLAHPPTLEQILIRHYGTSDGGRHAHKRSAP